MKKKIPLEKKLAAYSTLGAAFLTAAPVSQGAVVYFDPADVTINASGTGQYFGLDIDGNSVTPVTTSDGVISANSANEVLFFIISNTVIESLGAWGQGSWAGSASEKVHHYVRTMTPFSGQTMVYGFNTGAAIGPGPLTTNGFGGVVANRRKTAGTSGGGMFAPSPTTGFMGVKMNLGSNIHYGWARMTVTLNPLSVTIHDYAYEDTPNTPILAGAGSAPPSAAVPTLGEWGLITLSLFLMSFGTVFLARQEGVLGTATAGANRQLGLKWLFSNPPFYLKEFKKSLLATAVLAAILGLVSIITTGGITAVDFFGTMVAGPLFAYLMHLIVAFEKESAARRGRGE